MTDRRFSSPAMIERLVGFDTTSHKSNLELIDWVEAYLAELGVAARRTYDAERRKANLFATIGPDIAGGIILSGHSDVVPVTGQAWDSDPFRVVEREGRLYGRGTADMKSFLAIALALVPEFLTRDLKRPLHLALSYDEEVSCLGVVGLIDDLLANLPRPAMVIIGEPSDMNIVNAHKGALGFRTSITGQAAHSSQPHRGANAIFAAARLIGFLQALGREKRAEAAPDSGFEPPYTTIQVGVIEGGSALNIIPASCSFAWECRSLPGDDGEALLRRFEDFAETEVLPELREFAPGATITTTRHANVPPLAPEDAGPAEALLRHLTGANRSHVVSFATEGGLFQRAGLSTVICGPGSVDQAHQPNEYVELSQVAACESLLRRLADWAAG
jgi:acetylornithine deacetylase